MSSMIENLYFDRLVVLEAVGKACLVFADLDRAAEASDTMPRVASAI